MTKSIIFSKFNKNPKFFLVSLFLSQLVVITTTLAWADVRTNAPDPLSCREKYIAEISKREGMRSLFKPKNGLQEGLALLNHVSNQKDPYKTPEEVQEIFQDFADDIRDEGFSNMTDERITEVLNRHSTKVAFCYKKGEEVYLRKGSDVKDYIIQKLIEEESSGIISDGLTSSRESISELSSKDLDSELSTRENILRKSSSGGAHDIN